MTEPADPYAIFRYRGIRLDPYRIFDVYGVTHGAQQHAIKKLLRAGRGHKSLKVDVLEAMAALQRWVEMMEEDQADG